LYLEFFYNRVLYRWGWQSGTGTGKNNKNKLVLYPGFVDMRMVDIWNTKDPQIFLFVNFVARTKMLIIYCFHTMWQFKLGVR
jgi:hypothetical protein